MPISMRGGAGYTDDQLILTEDECLHYLFIYLSNSKDDIRHDKSEVYISVF